MREIVRPIAMNFDICILWVSGEVDNMSQVVSWLGGFICPTLDEGWMYTMMKTMPAGGTEGDIIVILADNVEQLDANYDKDIIHTLKEWGIYYE